MPAPVTVDMVRDAYAQWAKPGAVLVTIDYDGLDEPILLTNWAGKLGEGRFGVVSNGNTFKYAPCRVVWIGASVENGAKEARLEVAALGEAVEAVRAAPEDIEVTAVVERVRVAAPNVVERKMKGLIVTSAEVAEGVISVPLRPRDYSKEYAVAPRYTIKRVPGLYG